MSARWIVLAMVLLPAAASAPDDGAPLAFPPQGERGAALAELVAQRLALRPAYVLASEVSSADAAAIEADTYQVVLRVFGPNGTEEEAWRGTQRVAGREGDVLHVAPGDLHEAIELQAHVTVLMPPGRYHGGDVSAAQLVRSTAQRLGLPAGDAARWAATSFAEAQAPKPVNLYGSAVRGVSFVLDCDDCTLVVHKEHPYDTVNVNFLVGYVAPDGSLVALQTSEWVDLDDPRFLGRDEAQARARQALEARGDRVGVLEFRGHAMPDRQLRYKWAAELQEGSPEGAGWVVLETDAASGALVEGPWRTAAATGPEEAPSPRSVLPDAPTGRTLPAPPTWATLALAALALAARRRA